MAVLRSFEKILGRALAVVPVTVSGVFKPSGQTNPTDGAAVAVTLVDVDGVPYTASGGGGGGGAVTIADGADVTQGAIANTAYTGVATTSQGYLRAIADAAISTDPSDVEGATASGSALTAKPVTGGGLAKTANPTAVDDGDVVNALHDKLGKAIAVSAIRELKGVQHTTITASTGENTIVTAAASTFHDVYGIIVANSSATATEVTIKDATAGTTRATIAVGANATAGFMLDAGSAIPQATANNNWTATAADSVTSLFITALYVKNI